MSNNQDFHIETALPLTAAAIGTLISGGTAFFNVATNNGRPKNDTPFLSSGSIPGLLSALSDGVINYKKRQLTQDQGEKAALGGNLGWDAGLAGLSVISLLTKEVPAVGLAANALAFSGAFYVPLANAKHADGQETLLHDGIPNLIKTIRQVI